MCETFQRAEWQVQVDRQLPEEWPHLLNQFEDANIYQTTSYGRIRWGHKSLSHIVLKRRGEVAAMAQLRIMQPKGLRLGIAYLRWGPVWVRRNAPLDPDVPRRMVQALEEEYVDKRGLTLRALPHVFAGTERAEAITQAFQSFAPEPTDPEHMYRTLVVDLSPSLCEVRKQFDRKWRNQLTSAEKKGLQITRGTSREEFEKFSALYRQMRETKRFDSAVEPAEFGRIQDDLPEAQRMQIFLCSSNAVPIAGAVVSAMGDSAIYLLGATNPEGRAKKGSYLVQWSIFKWLKEMGVGWYDLGGINELKNPGVYHFKSGMSGRESQHIGPLVASKGILSSKVIATGLAIRRAFGALG